MEQKTKNCVLSVDQSTSGTKALLFDANGALIARQDVAHRQIIRENGWVEHDGEEIYQNLLETVRRVLAKSGVSASAVRAMGISNQRETAIAFSKSSGRPLCNAVVWQCPRGEQICVALAKQGKAEQVREATGLRLSPYFSAAKLAWLLQNEASVQRAAKSGDLLCGNMDSYLVYRLTGGKVFKTDFSNASRTQLFNIFTSRWDEELCALFGIAPACLPQVEYSDGNFGETTLEGIFEQPVPIRGVMGDSHAALFAQGCLAPGMVKATYGTGSSVMMNIGKKPVLSQNGIVSSVGFGFRGEVHYVLEGNINYTGSVTKWLVEDVQLIENARQAGEIAGGTPSTGGVYLVPAFTGLGAPYWNSEARAVLCGMNRNTGKKEIVRAAEECIAYQINDILRIMEADTGTKPASLAVDGGPTRDAFLMGFQASISDLNVAVPAIEELSGAGAAYMAGQSMGMYRIEELVQKRSVRFYEPQMQPQERQKLCEGWAAAVRRAMQ